METVAAAVVIAVVEGEGIVSFWLEPVVVVVVVVVVVTDGLLSVPIPDGGVPAFSQSQHYLCCELQWHERIGGLVEQFWFL